MLCHDFSTSLNLKHRQILLGRSALCTMLAKRLLCFQNAVAVNNAHARVILLRGLSTVLRDAQSTFLQGISWFSLPSFYVRIFVQGDVRNFFMLEVRPGDSIDNVIDRIISTMHLSSTRDRVRLIVPSDWTCEGGGRQQCRQLNPDNRVCDHSFLRPHTTIFVVARNGPGG